MSISDHTIHAPELITKISCAVCGGSAVLHFFADNSDLLTGVGAATGMVGVLVGLFLQWRRNLMLERIVK